MDVFQWLQEWYIQNCDGDWEHCYGIKIGTLDNPGWSIDICKMTILYVEKLWDKMNTI